MDPTDSDTDEISLTNYADNAEDLFQAAVTKKVSVDFVKLFIESGSPHVFTNKDKHRNNLLHLVGPFNIPVKMVELFLDNGPEDLIMF